MAVAARRMLGGTSPSAHIARCRQAAVLRLCAGWLGSVLSGGIVVLLCTAVVVHAMESAGAWQLLDLAARERFGVE